MSRALRATLRGSQLGFILAASLPSRLSFQDKHREGLWSREIAVLGTDILEFASGIIEDLHITSGVFVT